MQSLPSLSSLIPLLALMLTLIIAITGASWMLGRKIAKAEDVAPKHDHNGNYVRVKECDLARENVHDKLAALADGQQDIFRKLDSINEYLRKQEDRP